jgi:hypothetical protein
MPSACLGAKPAKRAVVQIEQMLAQIAIVS